MDKDTLADTLKRATAMTSDSMGLDIAGHYEWC